MTPLAEKWTQERAQYLRWARLYAHIPALRASYLRLSQEWRRSIAEAKRNGW